MALLAFGLLIDFDRAIDWPGQATQETCHHPASGQSKTCRTCSEMTFLAARIARCVRGSVVRSGPEASRPFT